MTLPNILLVIAVGLFILDSFGTEIEANLFSLGWAFVIAAVIVARVIP